MSGSTEQPKGITAIVLCGGLGTRLGELTRDTPKPMMMVGERPFLAYVLDSLCTPDVESIVLAVGFRWQVIVDFVGDHWRGWPVRYSVEDTPLGTGGAVRLAMQRHGLQEALVLNGDTLFRIDLGDFLRTPLPDDCSTRIALGRVEDVRRYGRVVLDNQRRVTAFGEKDLSGPGLINGGIYLQRFAPLAGFGEQPFSFETDYLARQTGAQSMEGMPFDAYFIDIGVPEGLERAGRELIGDGNRPELS